MATTSLVSCTGVVGVTSSDFLDEVAVVAPAAAGVTGVTAVGATDGEVREAVALGRDGVEEMEVRLASIA